MNELKYKIQDCDGECCIPWPEDYDISFQCGFLQEPSVRSLYLFCFMYCLVDTRFEATVFIFPTIVTPLIKLLLCQILDFQHQI